MVRPRLVEEGVPIGQYADDGGMETEPIGSLNVAAAPATYHQQHQQQSSCANQSSLLRAVGGQIKAPHRPTRVVIGGDDDEALLDGSDSYSPTYSAPNHTQSYTHPHHHHSAYEQRTTAHTPQAAAAYNYHPHRGSHQQPLQQQPPNDPMFTSASTSLHYPNYVHQAVPNSTNNRHYGAAPTITATHIEIGSNNNNNESAYSDRMEGVEDLSEKPEMIVFDGANVAYAYTQATLTSPQHQTLQPNVRGLHVAMVYFTSRGFRVLIVLPQNWLREDQHGPLWRHHSPDLYRELSPFFVKAPSGDDDDAYALQVARLENQRAAERARRFGHSQLQGPAYVLSNDWFRDAQDRDVTGQLRAWLNDGVDGTMGPGRIPYTFGDLQRMDQYGDRELDLLPSARHPLIERIQREERILP